MPDQKNTAANFFFFTHFCFHFWNRGCSSSHNSLRGIAHHPPPCDLLQHFAHQLITPPKLSLTNIALVWLRWKTLLQSSCYYLSKREEEALTRLLSLIAGGWLILLIMIHDNYHFDDDDFYFDQRISVFMIMIMIITIYFSLLTSIYSDDDKNYD